MTTKAAPTPGPWRFKDFMLKPDGTVLDCEPETPVSINILGGTGPSRWGVASLQSYFPAKEHEQHLANARLIAAAPDMFRALQLFVKAEGINGWQGALPLARAALAAALGE